MSEPATEQPAAPEAIELPAHGDAAFATLMDTLVAEEAASKTGEGEQAPAAAGGSGSGSGAADAKAGSQAAPAADGAAGGTAAAVPTAGDGTGAGDTGKPAAGGAQQTPGAGPAAAGADGAAAATAAPGDGSDRPAAWTAAAADYVPKLGELSTQIENKTAQAYQTAALDEVKTEHEQYFKALEMHPRQLIGTQVPRIGGEGMETLKDSDDAKEWQDAVKSILVEEVRDRATRQMEENAGFLDTVHASIELFQNNTDLIPGTKEFDVELANRFANLAAPYELRVEEKLQGYSIPVQPIIDAIRKQLVEERAQGKSAESPPAAASGESKPAAAETQAAGAAAPPATAPAAPASTPAADPPQAGIQSKAGNSSENEDFSTLFGTIGLPNLQI